jgi:hypothetical protein
MMTGATTYSRPLITAMTPSATSRARNRFRIATIAVTTRIAPVTCRKLRCAWDACRVTQIVAICTNRTRVTAHAAVIVADSA